MYAAEHDPETDAGAVREMLDAFVGRGLMLAEEGHFLSLALPSNRNW